MPNPTQPADWYADPGCRHELRYWDGTAWTDHVSSGGRQTTDPLAQADEPSAQTTAVLPVATSWGPTATVRVCPHCGTQAQNAGDRCPRCGKGYAARARWPWVVGGVLLAMLLFVACAVALAVTAGKKITDVQAKHAISQAQFDDVAVGTSRADVITQLGKQPGSIQDFQDRGVFRQTPVDSSCIYYWRTGAGFGEFFQFCFTDDRLFHKGSARAGGS